MLIFSKPSISYRFSLHTFPFIPMHATCRVYFIILDFFIVIVSGKHKLLSSSLCDFLQLYISDSLIWTNILLSAPFSNNQSCFLFLMLTITMVIIITLAVLMRSGTPATLDGQDICIANYKSGRCIYPCAVSQCGCRLLYVTKPRLKAQFNNFTSVKLFKELRKFAIDKKYI